MVKEVAIGEIYFDGLVSFLGGCTSRLVLL